MQTFDDGFAVLVGVGRCAYKPWSLPVAARDVEALKGALTDPESCAYPDDPRHVRLLTDEEATRGGILAALDELAENVCGRDDSTAVVYYSGHGWLDEESGRYFLVPYDVEPRKLLQTALPAERLIEALRRVRSRRLLVILDTCHAEGMATAKDASVPVSFKAPPEDLIQALGQGEGRVVFSSCRGEEKSWVLRDKTLSIFTRHFLEALDGAGNRPGDQTVRLSHLMTHLTAAVSRSAWQQYEEKQTPIFEIKGENFPVAFLTGGKGPDRPEIADAALAALRRPETCVYLGSRYGLTPHSPAHPQLLNGLDLGLKSPNVLSLAEAMSWLATQLGLTAARGHLSERYARLDAAGGKVVEELSTLAPLVTGHSLATATWSARIQAALGPNLTVVNNAGQIGHALPRSAQRALLLMLHGSEHDFQNAMVVEKELLNYRRRRADLAREVSRLLESPWIVLGAEKRADTTFHMLAGEVCDELGASQRPIFVVDPRPEHLVRNEWPGDALRHVPMTPREFLSLAVGR